MKEDRKKIAIIGAGISGLSLAYYLSRYNFEIVIYDKKAHPGGMIQTLNKEYGLVETAANGCMKTSLVASLFEELSLPYLEAKKSSNKRYLYWDGAFSRWPLTILGTIRLIWGVLKTLFKLGRPEEKQTVHQWASKQFGEQAASRLISPALQGIYAQDGHTLSAPLLFNRFFNRKTNSKKLGGLITPKEGMGSLIISLENYLKNKNVQFIYEQEINNLDGSSPYVFAGSLTEAKKFAPTIFESSNLTTSDITTITISTQEKLPLLDGFGALFPREENVNVLGILINGNIFENRVKDGQSYTFIYKDKVQMNSDQLIELVKSDIFNAFKKKIEIADYQITHWPASLPVYDQNLEEFLQKSKINTKNLYFTGNYLGKLGLTGILEQNFNLAQTINNDLNHAY